MVFQNAPCDFLQLLDLANRSLGQVIDYQSTFVSSCIREALIGIQYM